jgi:hypothetical protein
MAQHPVKNWTLLNDGELTESYLTWQDESVICIGKIPNPINPRVADCASFGEVPSYWQADHFINLNDFEMWEKVATNSDEGEITITSVSSKPDGLTVTATNRSGNTLTFLKSKDGWHAFTGTHEVRRIRKSTIDWSILLKNASGQAGREFTDTLVFKTRSGESVKKDVMLLPRKIGGLSYYQLYEFTNVDKELSLSVLEMFQPGSLDTKLSRPVWEIYVPGQNFGNFSIVSNEKRDGYFLIWTDVLGRLCLSAITNMWPDAMYVEDPNVGPFSYPKDDPSMRGGVDHIIDLRQFADGERFFKGGGGVASASETNNVLTLNVTNAAGSKFKFSNQGGQWHAYSFWGEINRIKK